MSSNRENDATASKPGGKRDRDQERKRRDWLVFLLILLLGFVCLLITAQLAVKPKRVWQVYANMLSELKPDATLYAGQGGIPPLRPEVLTPPSWDPRYILTPVGTLVAVPPGTLGPAQTTTPTPQEIASLPTPSTSVTPSPSTTPTQTPTGTPTSTPTGTPTSTPTGTSTPTASPTATSTPTATPEPPTPTQGLPPRPATDTPTPSETPTPTDTPTPTPTPVPPPIIFSITPNQGVNTPPPVTVTILGANFFGLPVVTLGDSATIAVSAATTDTITGTVPAGLTPGVYALTVRNPDLQYGRLSPAYIVLNVPSPNTTLETGYISTFGPAASGAEGDDDHVQVIFFEVPDGTPGNLYVRIFDADTGGVPGSPPDEQHSGTWDTTFVYTLRGGSRAYSEPDARSHRPGPAGINSGDALLAQAIIGEDTMVPLMYDNLWGLVFGPYTAGDGELVGGRRVFKLVVEGASGDDGNYYNAVLSTAADDNVMPAGSRVFAYAWTLPLDPDPAQRPPLYPYVAPGAVTFEQHNWDMDWAGGIMTLHTPMRDIVVDSAISQDDEERSSVYGVQTGEGGATWTATLDFFFAGAWNDVTFWAVGDGADLAIFTHPTMAPPP